jgi:EmrB/QacA subfamily drug resistance transporter
MTQTSPPESRPAPAEAEDAVQHSGDLSPSNRLVAWVVASGMFMNQLDSTVVTTSIPQIAESLGEEPLKLSFAITAYLISLAVFIPISGWIADRFGPRRVFCTAIAIFTASSALCGLSFNLPMMVACRVLQGFGGALMTPVGRLILIRSFPKDQLYAALAFVSIPALVAPTVGPIFGGLITTYISWRWIFFMNLPIGILGIFMALRAVKNFKVVRPDRFDFVGFIIVGAGLALCQLTFENLGRHRIVSTSTLTVFAIFAVICLGVYTWYALSRQNPVLDLNLFRIRTFRTSTVSGGLCRLSIGGVLFLLPLMLQVGFGMTPVASGAITFITSLGAMGMKTVASRVARVVGFRNLLVYNSFALGATVGGMSLFQPDTPHWQMLIYLFIYGVVRSTQFTNIQALAYADLTPEIMSRGTSMASVVQQLSNSFGVAMAASVLALVVGQSVTITPHDFHVAFILLGLCPIVAVFGFLRMKPTDGAELAGQGGRRRRG